MSQEMVDAEVVDYKWIGPNFVIVRLPDGTDCKLTLEVTAVKLKDQKGPDGSPIFNVNWNVFASFRAPRGKLLKVPKPQIPTQAKPMAKDTRIIG